MPKSQSYSIASCVVETGYRLRATSGDSPEAVNLRAVGSALLTAEVLSFRQLPWEGRTQRNSQGLEISLGFYDQGELKKIEDALEVVRREVAYSLGGFIAAFELRLTELDKSHANDWLGVDRVWPQYSENRHLHTGINSDTDLRGLWGNRSGGRERLARGQTKILARRLRYRYGVDWAKNNNSAETLFWWSTAQTESWIARLHRHPQQELDTYVRREFNWIVGEAMRGIGGTVSNVDPLTLTADDWGAVELDEDPITVHYIGPKSEKTDTHADVKKVLDRAGKQLKTKEVRCKETTRKWALQPFTSELTRLAADQRLAEHRGEPDVCDVVIVYRGGGITEYEPGVKDARNLIDDISREEFKEAINALTELGIEVVLGIGHGTIGIYVDEDPESPGTKLSVSAPVGVHEAITPTAAAAWILREHINHRLVDSNVDPGQAGQLVEDAP